MGNYSLCKVCGNLYEKTSKQTCSSCNEIYYKIRSLVEAKPDTIVLEISTQTGVSVSKILSFVKHGFFEMNGGTMEVK